MLKKIPSNWGGISLLEWRHFHEFKFVFLHSEKSIRFAFGEKLKLKMNYDKKLESCKESIWSHSYIIGWIGRIRRFMSHNEILHRSSIWNSRPNITSKSWQTLVNQILYLMMSKILRKYGPVTYFLRLLQICNILVWNTCEQCSFPFLKRTIPGEKVLKKNHLCKLLKPQSGLTEGKSGIGAKIRIKEKWKSWPQSNKG